METKVLIRRAIKELRQSGCIHADTFIELNNRGVDTQVIIDRADAYVC